MDEKEAFITQNEYEQTFTAPVMLISVDSQSPTLPGPQQQQNKSI